jgi:hypothetical protein
MQDEIRNVFQKVHYFWHDVKLFLPPLLVEK